MEPADRRNHARLSVTRPTKVYLPRAHQYVAGSTRDVSVGGALIEVRTQRPLNIGDYIDVGVAWSEKAVLSSESLLPGRVVRVQTRANGVQSLAVEFLQQQRLAAAA